MAGFFLFPVSLCKAGPSGRGGEEGRPVRPCVCTCVCVCGARSAGLRERGRSVFFTSDLELLFSGREWVEERVAVVFWTRGFLSRAHSHTYTHPRTAGGGRGGEGAHRDGDGRERSNGTSRTTTLALLPPVHTLLSTRERAGRAQGGGWRCVCMVVVDAVEGSSADGPLCGNLGGRRARGVGG